VALGQVASRARVLIHEVSRAEKLAERRRASRVDHAGRNVEKHRARHVHAAGGLVVKHGDAVELRIVIDALLAVDTNAVLVA
jgi:hypothetical protein